MFADISKPSVFSYTLILIGTICVDLVICFLIRFYPDFWGKPINDWYNDFGLNAVIADVLIIVLGLLITQVVYGMFVKGWNLLLFAGIACAVLAWGTAAGLGSPPKAAFNHEAIRESIRNDNDDALLYKTLEYYATADVARTSAPQEEWVQKRAIFLNGINSVLYALGGVGALAAAIAGLTMLVPPKAR